MNLREEILREHSKKQAIKISEYIGSNTARFDELIQLMLEETYRVSQRAAWVLTHCVTRHPHLIKPYYRLLLENLQKEKVHVAVKRNTVRILQDVQFSEDLLGLAADISFGYLMDVKEAVAVRIFSMAIAYNICLQEPELANELRLIIEEHLPHGSAGYKSRGKKILKKLSEDDFPKGHKGLPWSSRQ